MSRLSRSGSRGAKVSVPSWSRMPPKPATAHDPGAGERGDVEAVAGVVLEVVEVDQGGFAEVVVGQLEVADLGRDHRLGAGRERGIADRQRLVVGEVAGLLLVAEGVAAQVQREHEVGLLDDLLAVEVEVGEVQEQRVLLGSGVREVPGLVLGEGLGLRMNARVVSS